MDKLTMLTTLAAAHHIDRVGVCAYDEQKRPLLRCRAMARLPQGARSVIVVLFPYATASDERRNISRYACVPDYHVAAGAVLKALCAELADTYASERFEAFMDNSPLPEVACAVAAGLGVRGDNGLLIDDRYGSYVFIGCIVTTMALPTEEQSRECTHCGACRRACPGGCLDDHTREHCVSALTQKKGELTPLEQHLVRQGGSLFGCDICQECCPMNRKATISPHPCFDCYDPMLTVRSLECLDGKAYGWRGAAVLKRNLTLFEE